MAHAYTPSRIGTECHFPKTQPTKGDGFIFACVGYCRGCAGRDVARVLVATPRARRGHVAVRAPVASPSEWCYSPVSACVHAVASRCPRCCSVPWYGRNDGPERGRDCRTIVHVACPRHSLQRCCCIALYKISTYDFNVYIRFWSYVHTILMSTYDFGRM